MVFGRNDPNSTICSCSSKFISKKSSNTLQTRLKSSSNVVYAHVVVKARFAHRVEHVLASSFTPNVRDLASKLSRSYKPKDEKSLLFQNKRGVAASRDLARVFSFCRCTLRDCCVVINTLHSPLCNCRISSRVFWSLSVTLFAPYESQTI